MRHIREILRLKWVAGRSHREIARSLSISAGVVGSVMSRARLKGLDWAAVEALTDPALDVLLNGPRLEPGTRRPLPDPAWLHQELRRPGVTLELLHIEYLERHPDGYRYTTFCAHYRRWLDRQKPVMRQVHRAGEKAFVDYSGDRPGVTDPATGEVTPAELFVGVLGASNYTFAEATLTQRLPDWLMSHVRMFEYFRGVTAALVPDQLKSGVTGACQYEPAVNRSYVDLAAHYGTAVIPARPGKPRDKAKVESAVLVAQRWVRSTRLPSGESRQRREATWRGCGTKSSSVSRS